MGKALGVAGSDEAKPGQRGLDLNLPTLVLMNLDSFVCCHVTIIGVCHGIRYSIFLLMAHRVVTWSDQKTHISPVLSSPASIVSFDSAFSVSDTFPSHFQMSLTTSEAPSAQYGANHTSLPDFLEDGKNAMPDDGSFLRHDLYFFKDGNVTFLVRSHRCFAHSTC